jgi:hypothetical protein
MITHNDMQYAISDDIKFEAFVHSLERTDPDPEDLLEFIRVVSSRWHDILLDVDADNEHLVGFTDDVLEVVHQQQHFAEEMDDDATINKHDFMRLLESMEMKFALMQENMLGW